MGGALYVPSLNFGVETMLSSTLLLLTAMFFLCGAQEKAPLYMFSTSTDLREAFGLDTSLEIGE